MSLKAAAVSEDRDMSEIEAAGQASAPADPPDLDDTVWAHPHIRRLMGLRAPAFILMLTVYSVIAKVLAFTLINPFLQPSSKDPLNAVLMAQRDGLAATFIVGILLAPILETFLAQWLPIRIGRIFTHRPGVLIGLSTAVFAAMHLHAGTKGVALGVSVGLLLGCSFVHWQRVSTGRAYWVTTAIHALHNGVALSVALLVMAR